MGDVASMGNPGMSQCLIYGFPFLGSVQHHKSIPFPKNKMSTSVSELFRVFLEVLAGIKKSHVEINYCNLLEYERLLKEVMHRQQANDNILKVYIDCATVFKDVPQGVLDFDEEEPFAKWNMKRFAGLLCRAKNSVLGRDFLLQMDGHHATLLVTDKNWNKKSFDNTLLYTEQPLFLLMSKSDFEANYKSKPAFKNVVCKDEDGYPVGVISELPQTEDMWYFAREVELLQPFTGVLYLKDTLVPNAKKITAGSEKDKKGVKVLQCRTAMASILSFLRVPTLSRKRKGPAL